MRLISPRGFARYVYPGSSRGTRRRDSRRRRRPPPPPPPALPRRAGARRAWRRGGARPGRRGPGSHRLRTGREGHGGSWRVTAGHGGETREAGPRSGLCGWLWISGMFRDGGCAGMARWDGWGKAARLRRGIVRHARQPPWSCASPRSWICRKVERMGDQRLSDGVRDHAAHLAWSFSLRACCSWFLAASSSCRSWWLYPTKLLICARRLSRASVRTRIDSGCGVCATEDSFC